jgi:hypothetical protein
VAGFRQMSLSSPGAEPKSTESVSLDLSAP